MFKEPDIYARLQSDRLPLSVYPPNVEYLIEEVWTDADAFPLRNEVKVKRAAAK